MKAAGPAPERTASKILALRAESGGKRIAVSGSSTARCCNEPITSEPRFLRKIHNRFHLNSLLAQVLFVQLHEFVEKQYETGGSKPQYLQSGHAWASFSNLFEPLSAIERVRLFENLLRFANDESYPPARSFFLAYAPVSFEHDMSGEYIGPGVWKPEAGSRTAALRVRRTLHRWCDWLEALVHFQVHQLHHSGSARLELDKSIILLWPLFNRHNWSFGTLLDLLRSRAACCGLLPWQTERQFAAYCMGHLKLHQGSSPRATTGSPDGLDIADRLLKFLPAMR